MSLKQNSKVAVIGSGISGLTYTYFLSRLRPDLKFHLYEASNRSSGYINTEYHNLNNESILLEKGPRTLRGTSDGTVLMIDTFLKLGSSNQIRVIPKDSEANKKWLLSQQNELIQVPNDWKSFNTFIKSSLGSGLISGLLKEPLQPKRSYKIKDESVHEFISRRFGPNLSNNIMSAVFHGIYGGDVKKLSAKAIIKSMVEMEDSHGSIIKSSFSKMFKKKPSASISKELSTYEKLFDADITELKQSLTKYPMIVFKNGLQSFTNAVSESFSGNPNIEVKFNSPVSSLKLSSSHDSVILNNTEPYDFVRSTVNANELADMIPTSSKTSQIASSLSYVDIFLVNVFIPNAKLTKHGFGFLVPQSNPNKEELLGVIFDSEIEKYSVPFMKSEVLTPSDSIKDRDYVKVTFMFGGHYWSEKSSPDTDELIDRTKTILERYLELKVNDELYLDHRYIKQCIPQFHVGYNDLYTDFHASLHKEFNGMVSHGGMSFGDGCGVPDVVMNSFRSALKCK